jgi:hypothetical protein
LRLSSLLGFRTTSRRFRSAVLPLFLINAIAIRQTKHVENLTAYGTPKPLLYTEEIANVFYQPSVIPDETGPRINRLREQSGEHEEGIRVLHPHMRNTLRAESEFVQFLAVWSMLLLDRVE